jgi:cyclase
MNLSQHHSPDRSTARSATPAISPGAASLEEIRSGVYAYLQRGSWGFSNAGLITSEGHSLLVDTLYDLRLTQQMLDAMRRISPAARQIDALVNTHANGDHCWGNQLVGEAKIISSRAAAQEMLELPPQVMTKLMGVAHTLSRAPAPARALLRLLGRLGLARLGAMAEAADFVVECFGRFEFRGIELRAPTETFEGQLDVRVGDKQVSLIEVGPAHTQGDAIVYVPADRVAFTGDILFIGSHPIAWEGPVSNWIAACDRLLALDVDVIVPGHGPLTDKAGVRETRDYWQQLLDVARSGHAAGVSPEAVASELLTRRFADWGEAHRLVVNLDTIYRELSGERSRRDPVGLFARMARWERARRSAA